MGASGGGLLQCFQSYEVGDRPHFRNVEVEKSTWSSSETRPGKPVGNRTIIWKHWTKVVWMNCWNKSLLVRTGVCQTLMPNRMWSRNVRNGKASSAGSSSLRLPVLFFPALSAVNRSLISEVTQANTCIHSSSRRKCRITGWVIQTQILQLASRMLLGKLSTWVTFGFLWSWRYDTISSLTSKKTAKPPHCLVGSLLLDPSQLCFPSGSPAICSPLTMIYSWMFCSVRAKLYVILKYEKSVCYQSHSGLAVHNSVIITSLLKRKM